MVRPILRMGDGTLHAPALAVGAFDATLDALVDDLI
jgi:hypothetical protein